MNAQNVQRVVSARRLFVEESSALATWWWAEIRDLTGALTTYLRPGQSTFCTLRLERDSGVIEEHSGGNKKIVMRVERHHESTWQAQLTEGGVNSKGVRLDVVVPDSSVLSKKIWLPEVAEANVDQILALRAERELPMALDALEVRWRVVERDKEHQRICVLMGAMKKEEVRGIESFAASLGYRILRISTDERTGSGSLNFFSKGRSNKGVTLKRIDRRLLWACIGLLMASLTTLVAQWTYERITVANELKALDASARTVRDLLTDLQKKRVPLEQVKSIMSSPSVLDLLVRLSGSFPDDSWIQRIEVQSKVNELPRVKLIAITPSGTKLAERLASDGQWQEIKLSSAMSAASGNSAERAEFVGVWRGGNIDRSPSRVADRATGAAP